MLNYQILAVNMVREYAKIKNADNQSYLENICMPFEIDVQTMIRHILNKPITINFHADRLSNSGKPIIDSLIKEGLYHGQFRTGTTNGGKTAYIGGNRFLWEQRLFNNAYPADSLERPKYGALNLFQYIDGASVRFGSCFFTLKHEVCNRCTFSYGDSSTNPTTLCTSDTFAGVLADLFNDVRKNNRLLNQVIATEQETLAVLLNPNQEIKNIGRNLDYCIETHIHGDISLAEDVDCFYVDESYVGTAFAKKVELLCKTYNIALRWIPKRQILINDIGELFRGPQIPKLAKRIDNLFGDNRGIVNAALIGMASCNSLESPNTWADLGNEDEIFQYFKQLWHTIAFFG